MGVHAPPKVTGSAAHPARKPVSEAKQAQDYAWAKCGDALPELVLAEINREAAAITEHPEAAEYHATLVVTYVEILAKRAKAVAEIAEREAALNGPTDGIHG
jgi:hypothetical protein